MPITPLPSLDRTAASFKADTNTFFGTLMPAFCTEANALASGMNAIAAGTAFAIPYTFSTTTADSDPGAGILRLDNATQNTATTIRIDLLGADAATYTGLIDAFDDSSSVVKGQIILQKLGDATKWLAFNLTSLASPSGYKNLTVANIASSAASPFTNGDSLILKFTRNGDKGDTGPTGTAFKPVMVANKYYTYPFIEASTTGSPTADRMYAVPVYIPDACTITKIGIEQIIGVVGNCRLGIYNIGSNAMPSTLRLDAGVVTTDAAAEKEIAIFHSMTQGWYFLVAIFDAGGASATTRRISTCSNGGFLFGGDSPGSTVTPNAPYVAQTYGALPGTFGTPTLANIGSAHPLIWVRI